MRNLFTFIVFFVAVFVACSSGERNDGRTISDKILKTPAIDSVTVCDAVNRLDTLITPEIFGRDFAIALVALAESDTVLCGKELNRRVAMLRQAYEVREGKQAYKCFDEGVQSYIDGLPVARRMNVYTRVSTPEQLGTALRIERYRCPADSAAIKEQVDALLKIYNEDELVSFMKYYNR